MSTQKINYWLEKRKNTFRKSGYEWALFVQKDDEKSKDNKWVLWEWEKKPLEKTVESIIARLNHAMDFAIRNIGRWEPPFLQTQRVTAWDKDGDT